MNFRQTGSLNRGLRNKAQYQIVIKVLKILHKAWKKMSDGKCVRKYDQEDCITDKLRWKMVDVKNRMKPKPSFRFHREAQSDDPRFKARTGLIDIMVTYTNDDQVYLTIECKKISSQSSTLAGKYVTEGINRFVTCKYSPGHPFAIMVGYVICGNAGACAKRVSDLLNKKKKRITGYIKTIGWQINKTIVPRATHYCSSHVQQITKSKIEIIHAFLIV
jgi:hypothetical protein